MKVRGRGLHEGARAWVAVPAYSTGMAALCAAWTLARAQPGWPSKVISCSLAKSQPHLTIPITQSSTNVTQGAGSDESPAASAARALGADSVNVTVDAVKSWCALHCFDREGTFCRGVVRGGQVLVPACLLTHAAKQHHDCSSLQLQTARLSSRAMRRRLTSSHRKGDVQMVGALVYKMLSFLEHETGGCSAAWLCGCLVVWQADANNHCAGRSASWSTRQVGCAGIWLCARQQQQRCAVDGVQGWRARPLPLGFQATCGLLHHPSCTGLASLAKNCAAVPPCASPAGERFEGKDHQYKWLSRLAMEVFGGRCAWAGAGLLYAQCPCVNCAS